jgi:hypothetical protein
VLAEFTFQSLFMISVCLLKCVIYHAFHTILGYTIVARKMIFETEFIELDEGDSDSDFEIISLNPNVNYESDESAMEDPIVDVALISPIKSPLKRDPRLKEKSDMTVKVPTCETHVTCGSIEPALEKMEGIELQKIEETSRDSIVGPDENSNDSASSLKKVRKKLNLEEYKMRRAKEPEKPLFDVPRRIAAYELCDVPASLPLLLLPTDPEWIASNQKSLAALDSENFTKSTVASYNPDHFEEITIVSMGCNTDITIPPVDDTFSDSKPATKSLSSIVNNLNKDNVESLLNSSTSLFSSIQAVVQSKCKANETDNEQSCEVSKESNEHGEDKTIMHLRKDRLRPFKCSIGLQTENISLFPPLLLTPCIVPNRVRKSRNYRRKISRSRSRSRSFSPSEYERVRYNSRNRYSRSQHSTHSSSMNSSENSSDSDSGSSSDASSHSSEDSLQRFNDRQNFRFYNRNQRDQGYNYQGNIWRVSMLFTLLSN